MELQFSQLVWQHAFSLRAFPMRLPQQQIGGFSWELTPNTTMQFHQDCFGNHVGVGRFDSPHTAFRYEMQGVAWINQQKRRAEQCMPLYRHPSEACRMTPSMQLFLKDCAIEKRMGVGTTNPVEIAAEYMQALHRTFQYQSGATHVSTTAGEAFAQGSGVCQDYAHILITLCRAGGIAARYVAGMIFGEGATHAWVEVHDGTMWHGLDPTHNKWIDDGYLKLAHGRDAFDCQLNRGVFCGHAVQQQNVYVNLEEVL